MQATSPKSADRRDSKKMNNSKTIKDFNKLWHEQTEISLLGRLVFKLDRKKIFNFLNHIDLTLNSKIIDVGCGTGSTLRLFRKYGYKNSIGIDVAESSLRLCEKNGLKRNKDVFLKNVTTKNLKNKFDLVFAEGVIEHYINIQPIVDSMCKISKKYILTTMPNLSSFYWFLFDKVLRRRHVTDYAHEEHEYINAFKKAGFKLIKLEKFSFNRGWIMLFEKQAHKS